MNYVEYWALAFLVTTVVEVPIVALCMSERPRWRTMSSAVFANLASHPIVWFVIPSLGLSDASRRVISESWAIVIEFALYWTVSPMTTARRAAGTSLVANGASLAVGLLLWG
jgi:hypothetical protein